PQLGPRPPNAFILFRRDFVEQHKGENILSPDKSTLSKRAGEAWGALPKADKTRYFDAAKAEADEHLRRNPGYQFRPNKQSRSESRR
ncbi:high mobility group box domain-containing protein, partial [Daedaleopsis nitida]